MFKKTLLRCLVDQNRNIQRTIPLRERRMVPMSFRLKLFCTGPRPSILLQCRVALARLRSGARPLCLFWVLGGTITTGPSQRSASRFGSPLASCRAGCRHFWAQVEIYTICLMRKRKRDGKVTYRPLPDSMLIRASQQGDLDRIVEKLRRFDHAINCIFACPDLR